MVKVVAVSGHFDPLHEGHILFFQEAKKLGDVLIVIMASDAQIIRKYGSILQPLSQRVERLMRKASVIDGVVVAIDKDATVNETLRVVRPDIFARGASSNANIPEARVLAELGCQVINGVGQTLNSSRHIRERIRRRYEG